MHGLFNDMWINKKIVHKSGETIVPQYSWNWCFEDRIVLKISFSYGVTFISFIQLRPEDNSIQSLVLGRVDTESTCSHNQIQSEMVSYPNGIVSFQFLHPTYIQFRLNVYIRPITRLTIPALCQRKQTWRHILNTSKTILCISIGICTCSKWVRCPIRYISDVE